MVAATFIRSFVWNMDLFFASSNLDIIEDSEFFLTKIVMIGIFVSLKSMSSFRRGKPSDPRALVPAVWKVFKVSCVAGSEIL